MEKNGQTGERLSETKNEGGANWGKAKEGAKEGKAERREE